jgi:cyclopropane fatty-acyl-phospholipid synthase-like methyltransferase
MIEQIYKVFNETDYSIFNDEGIDELCIDPEEINADQYRLKYAISKILKPVSILELGIGWGHHAHALLSASPKAIYTGINLCSSRNEQNQLLIDKLSKRFSNYNYQLLYASNLPAELKQREVFSLIYINSQKVNDKIYDVLSIAIDKARWIVVCDYLSAKDSYMEVSEFLIRYKDAIEFSISIPEYSGELIIRVKDDFRNFFPSEESGSAALVGLYNSTYYLNYCGGCDSFIQNGAESSDDPRILCILAIVSLRKKGKLLDLGCGRGEVSLQAALNGFDCTGVDYSEDAISISRSGQESFPGLGDTLRYEVSNVATYEPNVQYDVVVASDVIEHMSFDEVSQCYQMVSGALSEEGIFVVHTFPNSWYYDYHYSRMRRKVSSLGGFLPSDPRSRFEKAMHINEQNPRVLRKQLEKSFKHVLLWFNSPDDPIGSLEGKNGHHRLSGYRDLYAIASNVPVDIEKVKKSLTFHLWRGKDLKGLSMEITQCHEKARVAESFEVSVEISNHTRHTMHSLHPNPINLSYHWLDPSSREPVVFDGLRTPFCFPLHPGSVRSFQANCQAPVEAGEYLLRFSLVQEQHAWFDQPPFDKFAERLVKISE